MIADLVANAARQYWDAVQARDNIKVQQQALDLTADMQQQLPSAAQVPAGLQSEPFEGSADPDAAWRARQEQKN